MPRLVPRWLCVVAFAVTAFSSAAHARPFDLIYADRVDVTNTAASSSFSYGNDIGLIVNTGMSDITASDLAGVFFSTASSSPFVIVHLAANVGFAAPILPHEAVGTLLPGSVLPALVHPGETLRNTFPAGILWLSASYPPGFSGTVEVVVNMIMGADVARYDLTLNLTTGPQYAVSVSHAGRVSGSVPAAAPAGSWGAIKRLYR